MDVQLPSRTKDCTDSPLLKVTQSLELRPLPVATMPLTEIELPTLTVLRADTPLPSVVDPTILTAEEQTALFRTDSATPTWRFRRTESELPKQHRSNTVQPLPTLAPTPTDRAQPIAQPAFTDRLLPTVLASVALTDAPNTPCPWDTDSPFPATTLSVTDSWSPPYMTPNVEQVQPTHIRSQTETPDPIRANAKVDMELPITVDSPTDCLPLVTQFPDIDALDPIRVTALTEIELPRDRQSEIDARSPM